MKYGIFLSDTLHEKLNGFVQFVWNAISDHELRREMREDGAPLRGEPSPAEDFRENADRMVKELSAQLRSCFRPAQHLID
ncbi:hypothetical protein G7077_00465 [Sphingomonas piscis]|uniref:Uncharacterized protein n=1 Tax=Sphingomonas piscis TaxID=2714943 RepID=A0A6G7YLK2_9SPHN|nr:hypothetical protein [Sphingomonas piscis]QIK77618.1 hypothetical protein G7077_00465 [Sphingomonas piscis]